MNVLVDISLWSLALGRTKRRASAVADVLFELIADSRVEIIGPIRQEILSGIRESSQFDRLRKRLAAFPDLPLEQNDYVTAARYYNVCRARGVHGSNTDFLICAVAARHRLAIYTSDRDFSRFAKHLPIMLRVV